MSPPGAELSGWGGDELARFFARLDAAPASLLLLDYDGTLAPFRENPAEARPYPGVEPLLNALIKGGAARVAIVTGRSLDSILPLLGLRPLPEIWASHGRERRLPTGEVRREAPSEVQRAGLERGLEAVRSAGATGRAETGRVEEKPYSVAFHVRGLNREISENSLAGVRALWGPLAGEAGLEIHPFDGGLELRARGRSKGDAVEAMLAPFGEDNKCPSARTARVPTAYLGDDETDEDAFRALGEQGLPVLVRGERRETAARVWLRPPGELEMFLRRWLRAGSRKSGGGAPE